MISGDWGWDRIVLTVSLVLIALMLPWWIMIEFFPYTPPAPPSMAVDAGEQRQAAYEMCLETMKASLKAPATADFLPYREDLVTITLDGEAAAAFGVASYVDAQNSFGAKIRTKFICRLQLLRGGALQLVDTATL